MYKHRLPRAKCQQAGIKPALLAQKRNMNVPTKHKKSEPIPHREKVRTSYVWWGKVDSNHRSYKQQIYSLSPLATREFPHIRFAFCVEPVDGLEPPTC